MAATHTAGNQPDKQIQKTYHINAPTATVWDALTNPKLIKQYFFGTEARSDWKEGSTIDYKGEWEGETYHDKGTILRLIPEKELTINHWSSRSGKPDRPENYDQHSYKLVDKGNKTDLIMSQVDHFKSEENRSKAWQHWDVVMDGLKKVVEK